jgi:hypothetical protein
MKSPTLQVGDIIRINRFFYRHVGIYVGPRTPDGRCVVHNDKGGGVVLSTLAEFSGGAQVYVEKPATGNWQEREAIAQRAIALLGQKFDLLTFNCEHLANLAQNQRAESPQIQGALLLILFVVGGIFLVRKT